MDSIIEKIQKLLALANSDNENEAKMATARANELLIKYNLSLQTIENHEANYDTQEIAETGLTLREYQKMISGILLEFFFVKVVIGRKHVGYSSGQWGRQKAQYQKTIRILGTKENCMIASYIFSYLNQVYPKLWKSYLDRSPTASGRDRVSYYTGLSAGIKKVLLETKFKVETETGMVVVDDPGLVKYLKKSAGGSYGSPSRSQLDSHVVRDGIEDGMKVNVRKPITSTATVTNKAIKGGG